jgi:hypothetical protein
VKRTQQHNQSDAKRRYLAERKWLDSYRPPTPRISGKHLIPIPPHVYESAGGFKKVGNGLLR